jgi:glycosyltransferase involved in cell wall biosynthesis
MLLGVPVILTGYSGVMDFADAETACIVNYTLVPVALEEYPGVEQQRWADADVADAARHMRWIHDQPEAARAMALRGQQRIKHELSPAKVGAAMIEMLTNDAAARYEA